MSEISNGMDEEKIPSTVNTLTILTFIGSGFGIISGVWSYVKSASNLAKMEEVVSKPDFEKLPDFAKKMYSPEALELYRKLDINKLPLAIINIISCLLCIYGALEMRKLKRSGFYTYCIGEILPFFGTLLFVGISFFTAGWSAYIGLGFAALFIALYAFQLKYISNL